jgi:YspA, cpYpsA-related SLOG family
MTTDDVGAQPRLILVTGGRTYKNFTAVRCVLQRFNRRPYPTLMHGAAPGLDTVAHIVASGWYWPIKQVPANWATEGKAAGPRRNHRMIAKGPDLCIAFPGGTGTLGCLTAARKANIPCELVITDDTAPCGVTITALTPITQAS